MAMRSIFVFDDDAARRLSIIRMNFGWTQKQLAEKLSEVGARVPQQTVSDIESGKIHHNERVTVYAIQCALGPGWRFVVYGKNAASYNESAIRLRYWREKFKSMGRKKNTRGQMGYGRAHRGHV